MSADQRFQAEGRAPMVVRCGEQRHAHGSPYGLLAGLLEEPVEFMAAGEMDGLNHGPFISLGMQLAQDFLRVPDCLIPSCLHQPLDYSRRAGPVDLMPGKGLPDPHVDVPVGLPCPRCGAEHGHDNGDLLFFHVVLLLGEAIVCCRPHSGGWGGCMTNEAIGGSMVEIYG